MFQLLLEITITAVFVVQCIFASEDVKTYHSINWTLATKKGFSDFERRYPQPAYNEVAPSACDVTYGTCDISCCSDQDCSEEQKESFTCLGGLQDGERTEHLTDWNCNHPSVYSPNWFNVLCYVVSNTPYLGEYFRVEPKLQQRNKIEAITSKIGFSFSKEQFLLDHEPDYDDYNFGTPVKTRLNFSSTLGYLYVPQSVLGTVCANTLPVLFLVDSDSRCLTEISPELCTQGGFSVTNYLVASEGKEPRYPQIQINSLGSNTTWASVRYKCERNGNIYVTFSRNVFDSDTDPILRDGDGDAEECDEVNVNSFFNSSTGLCENVPVSVEYQFVWSGRNIVHLNVAFVLANVPVTLSSFADRSAHALRLRDFNESERSKVKMFVTQHFSVLFHHIGVDTDNSSLDLVVERRSGNPGYDFGKPIFILNSVNESDVNSTGVETTTSVIGIWKSGEDCEEGATHPLLFGHDVRSTCTLRLSADDFRNCSSLRGRVSALQGLLVKGDVIVRGGDVSNITSPSQVAPILRDYPDQEDDEDDELAVVVCRNIPSVVFLDILYTDVDVGAIKHIYRIAGARVRISSSDWHLTPCDFGSCSSKESRDTYFLTSAVTFSVIPQTPEGQMSRFWRGMALRARTDIDWDDLFRPFSQVATGDDLLYVSRWGILLAAGVAALYLALRNQL